MEPPLTSKEQKPREEGSLCPSPRATVLQHTSQGCSEGHPAVADNNTGLCRSIWDSRAPQVALVVKNLPADAGNMTCICSLGQEDPPEEGMATHSSILAWRIPWTEGPGRLQSMGLHRIGHD